MAACRFGQKTAKQVIDQVASNDAGLETLDLTKSASFRMKSVENTLALCEALKKNTVIKTVVLRECDIVDAGVEAIGEVLGENHHIEELDLQTNKVSTKGAISLAQALAKNKGVRTLNLMNQSQQCMGEDALEAFIKMFDSNLTLTKLMWKVDSRRAWELSKLLTRNVEIHRRMAAGAAVGDLLPKQAVPAPAAAVAKAEPAPKEVVATAAPPAAPVVEVAPATAETVREEPPAVALAEEAVADAAEEEAQELSAQPLTEELAASAEG